MQTRILFVIAVAFIIVCLIAVGISFFWAKKQALIYPKTLAEIDAYRFYFQKIVDKDNKIAGFEALLRKYDKASETWILPEEIGKFTLREVIYLLDKSFLKNGYPDGFLSINISPKQLADPRYVYFINWVKGEIYPMKVRIEFQIDPKMRMGLVMKKRLKQNLLRSKAAGVDVILEQISPDKRYYKKVRGFLPLISGVKVPLSKFQKKDKKEWFYLNIGDWARITKSNHTTIDLTEIEGIDGVELANVLDIHNRQGYYFGKPEQESDLPLT